MEKDVQEDVDIVHSLFIKERLVYIVEFNITAIKSKLEEQIVKKCETQQNAYVRCAYWTYLDWRSHPSLKIHYVDKNLLSSNPDCVNKSLHKILVPPNSSELLF